MEEYSTPPAMKRLGALFEKYTARFKPPQSSIEKECVVVIKEITGFELLPSQVVYTVSTKTISLQVPSLLKTEIRFHQTVILKQLEARLGKNSCPHILR